MTAMPVKEETAMDASNGDYGLWTLVAINSIFFILFAASYFKPQSKQECSKRQAPPLLAGFLVLWEAMPEQLYLPHCRLVVTPAVSAAVRGGGRETGCTILQQS